MRWLSRDYSSLVYGQWSTEHAGSVRTLWCCYPLLGSGFRAVLACNTGHGGVLCIPQAALDLC